MKSLVQKVKEELKELRKEYFKQKRLERKMYAKYTPALQLTDTDIRYSFSGRPRKIIV